MILKKMFQAAGISLEWSDSAFKTAQDRDRGEMPRAKFGLHYQDQMLQSSKGELRYKLFTVLSFKAD